MYFNVWYVPANCICFFIFHMVCNGIYMVMGFDDTCFIMSFLIHSNKISIAYYLAPGVSKCRCIP